MRTVFADAFYFVALRNRTDQYHKRTLEFARQFRGRVVTTEWVLAEFADALSGSSARARVPPFIQDLAADPMVRIIPADNGLFSRGLALYEARPDKEWSLTDCISFVVMKDEGILEALTGDQHFEQAGYAALLK